MKALSVYILLLLLFQASFSQFTLEETPIISRQDLFTADNLISVQISKDGKSIFYRKDSDKDSNIHHFSIKNPKQRLHIQIKDKIKSYRTAEIGLLALVDRRTNPLIWIDEEGKQYAIPLKGEITSARFLAKGKLDPDNWAIEFKSEDEKVSGIYIFNEAKRTLKKKYDEQALGNMFFDGELNLVAGHGINPEGGIDIYLFLKKKNWTAIVSHPFDESMLMSGFQKVISVSADGNEVYFTSNLNSDKILLKKYTIESKKFEVLAENALCDILPFGASVNELGEVTSVVGLYAKSIHTVIDKEMKGHFDYIAQNLKGDLSWAGSNRDHDVWLIRELNGGPPKFYVYYRDKMKLEYLFRDMESMKGEFAQRKAHTVETRDGHELPVHVYLPVYADHYGFGRTPEALPTILYVHGGPWVGITQWNNPFYWRNYQLLANRGYAVVVCEFRGGTGLGKENVETSYKAWGTQMHQDKLDIAKWAIKKGIADSSRIGIWGWSYGGYAAMAGLTRSPQTYACGIAMYGISDLVSFGKIQFANNEFWQKRVGNSYDQSEAKMLAEISPINHVNEMRAPMLLTTGSKDERVPQSQMDRMASAMSAAGKDITYFYYPEEGHDYRAPESWISFWAIAEQFLAKHLGGRFEPKGEDVNNGNFIVKEGAEFIEGMK